MTKIMGALLVMAIPAFWITFFILKWDDLTGFLVKFFRMWVAICIFVLLLDSAGCEPSESEVDYNIR